MLSVVGASWSLSCAHTDKDADFPTWPLVHHRLIKNLRRRVICARAFINKDMLTDLDRLESKSRRGSRTACLPYCAVKFRWWFPAGIVGAQKHGRSFARRALV